MVMPNILTGIRRAGPVQTLGAVAVNLNVLVYDNIAGRNARITKIAWRNNNAAPGVLRVGVGVAGAGAITDLIPPITIPALLDGELDANNIPAFPTGQGAAATHDIMAQASVGAAAPNDVVVQVELEVFGA